MSEDSVCQHYHGHEGECDRSTVAQPSALALWTQVECEHPADTDARRQRYHDLMVEHGHIVKAKPGEDRNLPCGWPHLPPSK